MHFVYAFAHQSRESMATKKYRVNQTIELATMAPAPAERREKTGRPDPNPNNARYRWSVSIHIDDNDVEGEPIVTASGKAPNESRAREIVERFTRLSLKTYDVMGYNSGRHDDDEDDDD